MDCRTTSCGVVLFCSVVLGLASVVCAETGASIGGAAVRVTADAPAFLGAPEVIAKPGCDHLPATRRFQGIPSLAISPKGRLWATWYAGITPREDQNNYVVVSTSGDGGKTWTETLIVDPDGKGPVRAFDPQVWVDPKGRLWSFWAQDFRGHDGSLSGVWAMTNDDPDKGDSAWSQPRRLTDGIMMCKPTVLSSGEWVLPASRWHTQRSARMVVSKDEGKTWGVRGAASVPKPLRTYDEHMIVERRDGSLWMLVRVAGTGIGESVSTDRGRSWSEVRRGSIEHIAARFFVRRLASGKLLLVKHADGVESRKMLTAYLSDDDGRTWSGGLLLDERGTISYPDGVQTDDGSIYMIYDRNRTADKEIFMAVFTEQDVAAGKDVSGKVRFRILVSQAGISR